MEMIDWLKGNEEIASALATVFSAVTALAALIVAIVTLRTQRRHDVFSVMPIPEVTIADYEDSLRIKLKNKGVGPMLLKSVKVTHDTEQKESIIAWMPLLPNNRPWNHYATDLKDRTIQPNGAIPLLELTQFDGEKDFAIYRDLVRLALYNLTVEIEYSDVYRTHFPCYMKPLTFFGRQVQLGNPET